MKLQNSLLDGQNRGGRPTVMTVEAIESLRWAFMIGIPDKKACFFAGISPATLYNYQAQNQGFLEQKDAWKLNPIIKAKLTIFNHLDEISIAKWYLERRARSEFGIKRAIKVRKSTDYILNKRLEELDNAF